MALAPRRGSQSHSGLEVSVSEQATVTDGPHSLLFSSDKDEKKKAKNVFLLKKGWVNFGAPIGAAKVIVASK